MISLITVVILCFIWGLFVTPLSISLSRQFNILDRPGGRKIHEGIIPRGAGIVLWSGYMLWVLFFVKDPFFLKFSSTAATLIFFTGYLDDMNPVNPYLRFLLHIVSASIIVLSFQFEVFTSIVLIFWIAGIVSAFNLIDGLDGLCIITFLISGFLAITVSGDLAIWLPLEGLAFGVLFWNFPVARTFLGDGGSTLLGFLFASHFLFSTSVTLQALSLLKLMFILILWGGIPVIDTMFAIIRRTISKASPFRPDRLHFHHRLLDYGLGRISVVIIMALIHFCIVYTGYFLFLYWIDMFTGG